MKVGFIVKHTGQGLGKILVAEFKRFTVKFFVSNETLILAESAGLKRALLPINTICKSDSGSCRITNSFPSSELIEPHHYQVEFDNGLTAKLSEVSLSPTEVPRATCPLEALSERQLEGYETFLKREAFANALMVSVRGGLGLRALLSSRIDLRPHQAFVAGTVLMDRLPRYLLADEVGLGKTIEAGIVIHDLLERNAAAKILILCPATLTQQWLSELYAKFSGRVFSLLELHRSDAVAGKIPDKIIVSFVDAQKYAHALRQVKWDLVVVDEAHHLLSAPKLYALAHDLSQKVSGYLLLSAVPAQHREDEYLRLLALLEPHRYRPNNPGVKEAFKLLYDRQIEISRKLSYLSRRLEEFAQGISTEDKITQKVAELTAMPVLSSDEVLKEGAQSLDPSEREQFVVQGRDLLHYIGDRYRISRRILRNRRSQLIEEQADINITRRLNLLDYAPNQLELDALNAVQNLLRKLKNKGLEEQVLLSFGKHLFQSLCDPQSLNSFIKLAEETNPMFAEMIEFHDQVSYQAWTEYAKNLWSLVLSVGVDEELEELKQSLAVWGEHGVNSSRTDKLIDFLKERHRSEPDSKILIFAGFFGSGTRLANALGEEFGKKSVARFIWEMTSKDKESSVAKFKSDSECWLLVSDETGGEGRNFQFAAELVHFDLPWHVSKIEQRIGRLDRLGREKKEVCSNVIVASGGSENGWLDCLASGFEIFTRSISGLEFSLHELERQITQVAIDDGYEGLNAIVGEVKAGAEAERADDDIQGMFDAASLERTRAEAFRRVQSTPERDEALEKTFCEWVEFIGGKGSMRVLPEVGANERNLEFRPNQFPSGVLPMSPDPQGNHADRQGTFRRKVAQDRPDLEFFSVGNEFFDAVCGTLQQTVKGRIYAVQCQSSLSPWVGFEFSYVPVGDKIRLAGHPGLVKYLERIFAIRAEHFFVGEDAQISQNAAELLALRRSLAKNTKDKTWFNFTLSNSRVQKLADHYARVGWDVLVKRTEEVARKAARKKLASVLESSIESETKRIVEQIRQAKISKAHGWEEEVEGLNALIEAVKNWDLVLDGAGFLSVNGEIVL